MTHAAEEALRRADALEEVNDMEGAICALTEAVNLERENPKYHALRGRLFHLRGQFQDAIRDFNSALALKPDAATTLYFRGRARAMVDDLDGALGDYERCIELQPAAADAFAEIGHIYHFKGDLVRALDSFRKAVELEPAQSTGITASIAEIESKLKKRR